MPRKSCAEGESGSFLMQRLRSGGAGAGPWSWRDRSIKSAIYIHNSLSMHVASASRGSYCCSSSSEDNTTSSFIVPIDGPGEHQWRCHDPDDPGDLTCTENHRDPWPYLPITAEWSAEERKG